MKSLSLLHYRMKLVNAAAAVSPLRVSHSAISKGLSSPASMLSRCCTSLRSSTVNSTCTWKHLVEIKSQAVNVCLNARHDGSAYIVLFANVESGRSVEENTSFSSWAFFERATAAAPSDGATVPNEHRVIIAFNSSSDESSTSRNERCLTFMDLEQNSPKPCLAISEYSFADGNVITKCRASSTITESPILHPQHTLSESSSTEWL